ncbi:ATP-binding protein [Actinomadura xylanilytica]|uniref:ATP-binding protein n=1 Tax=Actinomadura xylanilytica TaxID=887459 RepID=UPI00255ACD0E|nr:BTAD domain-containing putative transcriptional regulator [Actinomadura xylanilytica]MDL4770814.1 BTAD domain-containing putative transcriptional regulator [Actinomadura xylanilytica]
METHTDEGTPITVSQPLIRAAICVLALKMDGPLGTERIKELLWHPEAAPDGTGAVKTCVSGVRRILTHDRLPRGHGGYRLRLLDGDALDLLTFRDLARQAQEAGGRGDRELAAEMYGRALGTWGDPPLADLPATPALSGVAAGLLDERRAAREALADLRLGLGGARGLVSEIRSWLTDEPLNEHLWTRLMLSLYRSGNKAEALKTYDDARDILVQETGTEPGPDLQRMWHRVKVDDAELAERPGPPPHSAAETAVRAAAPPLAQQLPPDLRDFTGRGTEGARLRDLLARPGAAAPPIAHISGAPGLGKTTLALHVAHAVAGSYPDGQFYVQLAGASSSPRDPAAVLNEVLRAIGVAPADIPDSLDERAALYRSRLAGRRILVVADDAASPDQVRPLLPGTPGCTIIITSRIRSPSVDGAHLTDLERLPPAEGLRMLGRIIGRSRVEADRAAAGQVVAACDGFPLALRMVGARLAARPAWPLAHMAGLLLEEGRRLDHLVAGTTAVRAHIEASYRALDARSRRTFRMLALAGPHDVAPWVVEILLAERPAADIVDGLVDRSLLVAAGVDRTGQPRYRLHDLLRDYAGERLAEDAQAEPALERLTAGWLELVDAADALIPRDPYFPAPERLEPRSVIVDDLVARLIAPDPAAWLDSELANLRTIVETACAAGRFRLATGLVTRMASHLHLQHHHREAEHLWRAVMASAAREGDTDAAAYARLRAAQVIAADRGRPATALPMIDECITDWSPSDSGSSGGRPPDSRRVVGRSSLRSGPSDLGSPGGRPPDPRRVVGRSSLRSGPSDSVQSRRNLARALSLRAYSAQVLGRLDTAERDAAAALEIARETGDAHVAFGSLRVLGLVLSQAGRHAEAVEAGEDAFATARTLEEPAYQGVALYSLVRALLAAGRYDRLPPLCEEGLRLTESIGHTLGTAYFHEQWGCAHQGLGEHERAAERLHRAATLFTSQEAVAAEAACRMRLAGSYRALGRVQDARTQLEWCADAFGELDRPEDERRARDALRELGG